jgi:hypothetical protein
VQEGALATGWGVVDAFGIRSDARHLVAGQSVIDFRQWQGYSMSFLGGRGHGRSTQQVLDVYLEASLLKLSGYSFFDFIYALLERDVVLLKDRADGFWIHAHLSLSLRSREEELFEPGN